MTKTSVASLHPTEALPLPRSKSLRRQRSERSQNPVQLQAFEWNLPADHKHWRRLRLALPALKLIGVNSLWLPPGSKAKDPESNGYDIYDAWDLGEFNQKGSVPTKWGTKGDLVSLAADAEKNSIGLVWDAIHNHRAYADSTEMVRVVEVDPSDRRRDITEPYEIEAWTKFNYEARSGKYSKFKYNKSHFNGTDWNQINSKRAIYRYVEDGKNWHQDVGTSQGNADYLMLENLDYTNPDVVKEQHQCGRWIVEELGLRGFRVDAVQHISWNFINEWASLLRKKGRQELMFIGEFWHGDVRVLTNWLDHMHSFFSLYDVPLMYHIARLSWHEDTDLREVFKNTLVEQRPNNAVTFIRNHDTQKGQAMDTSICTDFMPLAYTLLLLRRDGHPCVFFGDLYGIGAPHPEGPVQGLPNLLLARKLYAYGKQEDYFERRDCIGWVRRGTEERPDGLAVIMSWSKAENADTRLCMEVGQEHAGEVWTDVLGLESASVVIDENGIGLFFCRRNNMACFVSSDAKGRKRFPVKFNTEFQKLLE
ncbi:glycoside hydrolase family 13 protein (alpha amylase) [Colletotrichum tofieldiae]|uniref:Glycoside hydrolase family 13 protein (Alpha amylase) n=1 Tax=Colletotrichum tofieldiae TaxID=708197 RepID=A0A166Y4F8_9PEZI|nr:glycoside hydrolase family 13 protein (alpha amylase) [Colletotrichum tofieldiae]GKT95642.1 glycoside hydrolase family 13 protein [Colletotrichum tofieldiae]